MYENSCWENHFQWIFTWNLAKDELLHRFFHTFFSKDSQANETNLTINYLFKVNNKNARAMWEICSKLIIKTTDQHISQTTCSSVFIVDFEQVIANLKSLGKDIHCRFRISADQIRISFIDLMFSLLSLFAVRFLENQSCIWVFVNFVSVISLFNLLLSK